MNYKQLKKEKERIREEIWNKMEQKHITLFPGAWGRIPNFKGREKASLKLISLGVWQNADTIKSNPDSPQQPVREKALLAGKMLYMAVPKLKDEKCFVELLPSRIRNIKIASTIKGAFKEGKRILPYEMKKIHLIIAGSVVVNLQGERIGKGGGFSDLEYAILRTLKKIDETTPVITTVHEIQVVNFNLPVTPHDILVDYIITPERIIKINRKRKQPKGILWEFLSPEKIKSIPILKKFMQAGLQQHL